MQYDNFAVYSIYFFYLDLANDTVTDQDSQHWFGYLICPCLELNLYFYQQNVVRSVT
jgi:hypothetical protein